MKNYNIWMLSQVSIISMILGWTLNELIRAGKEIAEILKSFVYLHGLQKSKKPANRLATKRISKVHF